MLDLDQKVLVVDDDMDVLDFLLGMLSSLGFHNIYVAKNGERAMDVVLDKQPDLVIHDINMPKMDGLAFISWLAQTHFKGGVCVLSSCDQRVLRTVECMVEDRVKYLGAIRKQEFDLARLEEMFLLNKQKTAPVYLGEKKLPAKKRIREAIENKEFGFLAQPKLDVASGEVKGLELLVRWRPGSGSMLSPDVFMPVIQPDPELLKAFNAMVVEIGLEQASRLAEVFPDIHMALNISTPCFSDSEFVEMLMRSIHMSELGADSLILELTERHPLERSALESLARLCLHNVGLSIDDFGIGFSNFDKLYQAPFSELKIDRYVMEKAIHEDTARSMVEKSIKIAHEMDMVVTVEGVEGVEQARLARELGCDLVQGYFYGHPMSLEELEAWEQGRSQKTLDESA